MNISVNTCTLCWWKYSLKCTEHHRMLTYKKIILNCYWLTTLLSPRRALIWILKNALTGNLCAFCYPTASQIQQQINELFSDAGFEIFIAVKAEFVVFFSGLLHHVVGYQESCYYLFQPQTGSHCVLDACHPYYANGKHYIIS